MDARNYSITGKIFEILNMIKGFEVATSNPAKGKIIARYKGVSYYIEISPIFNDNEEGKEADSKPFKNVVETHRWIFK